MTNEKLIAFLSLQPKDAEVYILVEEEGRCPLHQAQVVDTIYPWKEIHLQYEVL